MQAGAPVKSPLIRAALAAPTSGSCAVIYATEVNPETLVLKGSADGQHHRRSVPRYAPR